MHRWIQDPSAWKPGTAMPNLKLAEDVRSDLVAYLQTLRGDAYRADPPWNDETMIKDSVRRGESLYAKVGCDACHGPAGAGGHPNNNVVGGMIPALTFAADGYTKDELKTLFHKGRRSTPADAAAPAPAIAMPAWGDVLTDDEIAALADYVYSLRPAKSAADDWDE
jgi:mono/diheme cytochrome c family protein